MKNDGALKGAMGLAVFSVIMAACAVVIWYFLGNEVSRENGQVSADRVPVVVIDAGHGGMDGGCVSDIAGETGECVLEKECNLAISKVIAALFRVSGYEVVMTRETDVMLDTESGVGKAKMRDLRARLEMAERYPDALLLSIHCNKFPDKSCRGLQVYYSSADESSGEIAESIQQSAVELLQPDNRRKIKKADSSIYLLHNAKQPAVLVECGFLSNPSEAAALASEGYQKQIAMAVVCGVMRAV